MRTAVLDIGSTACRLVVAEAASGGWFHRGDDRAVVLGLARAVRRDGVLGEGLVDLTVETVRRLRDAAFRAGADRTEVEIAAGLAAAGDLALLRTRLAHLVDEVPRVRTPADEVAALTVAVRARLGDVGPSPLVALDDHALWTVADVTAPAVDPAAVGAAGSTGGGLRDLTHGAAVDPLHPAAVAALRARVVAAVTGGPDLAGRWPVLAGAAATTLGRAAAGRRWGADVAIAPAGLRLSRAALADLATELLGSSGARRLLLPGLDPAAVDELAVTAVALDTLVTRTGAAGLVVADVDVLDGRVLAALGTPPGDGVRRRAVASRSEPHGRHVARLAAALFDATAAGTSLDVTDRCHLVTAARLHGGLEGGVHAAATHRDRAHRLLVDGLPGVAAADLVEIACLVRFRTGRPPGGHLPPFARLPAARRSAITALAARLRLACGLDRGDGVVRDVRVRRDGDRWEVEVGGCGDLEAAVHGARSHLPAVRAMLGHDVTVRAAAADGASAPHPVTRLVPRAGAPGPPGAAHAGPR